MNTTDQIYEIVNRAKIDLENAQHKLKTSFNEVQRLAHNTINLSSGNATSRVAEIARKSKTASDEFYASCQALVFMIDHSCRGIVNENIDTRCIREVLDTIKLLNSESEIQANFSGTFDNYNLGDLVSVTYTPSIESKIIQQFWESLYNSRPDVVEFNKVLEKEKKIAAKNKRKKDEEHRLKKEEEQNRNAKMEEHYNKICEECKDLVRTYDASIDNTVKEQISLYKKELISKLTAEKEEKINVRDGLSFFKMSEKKRLTGEIEEIGNQIRNINTTNYSDDKIKSIKSESREKKNLYKSEIEVYIENRFPFFKRQKEEIQKKITSKADYNLHRKIFNRVSKDKYGGATWLEIKKDNPTASERKIIEFLRTMVREDVFVHEITQRTSHYYSKIETTSYEDYLVPTIAGIDSKWYEDPVVAQMPYPAPSEN